MVTHIDDIQCGGIRLIPVDTPVGRYRVWTKRVGTNPRARLLLLHGGPAMTHEYFEVCDSFLPDAGIEYYYYDQLGSYYSDQPDEPDLWQIPRFVDEVEQVRQALGLDAENFFLYGHSWGGILAMEYALAHQEHLKGLIISNMMSDNLAYDAYAENVLKPGMPSDLLAEFEALEAAEDFDNPRYEEILMQHHYVTHVLRMPAGEWPDPVDRTLMHTNKDVYVPMQGPSELGIRGRIAAWSRSEDIHDIAVPTLVIGAAHDTMDPAHLEWMAQEVQNGRYLHCPDGSHLPMYDDQQVYFEGLLRFLRDVDEGVFQ